MDKNDYNYKLQIFLCSLFSCFLFFIFAPLEIYLSNKTSFWFSIYDLIPYLGIFFIMSLALEIFVFYLINIFFPSLTHLLIMLQFSISFALYIQGNYIIADYGILDGNPIKWDEHILDGIISNGLFILLVISSIIVYFIVNRMIMLKVISIISTCIVLIQLITLSTLLIQKNGFEGSYSYTCTTKDEFNYSNEQNLIVLLLDNFDGQLFSDLLDSEQSDHYSSILKDFTFFSDAMTMYSATDMSLPQILTGENYKNDMTYGDFINYSFEKSPLLNNLSQNNWNNYIYTIQIMPQNNQNVISNLEYSNITVSSHKKLLIYIYKLVGFRYMPQVFKQNFWFYPDDINSIKDIKNANGQKIFDWSNFTFYNDLSTISSNNDKKSFFFYHLEGTHTPYNMNADFTISDKEVGVENEAKGITILINQYLNKLKETGVYDKSAIVIMADHGCYGLRQHPILCIKGVDEHHELQISSKPVSYQNIQNVLNELANKASSHEVFNNMSNSERIFYYYDDSHLSRSSISNTIIQYKTTSTASDDTALAPTGVTY